MLGAFTRPPSGMKLVVGMLAVAFATVLASSTLGALPGAPSQRADAAGQQAATTPYFPVTMTITTIQGPGDHPQTQEATLVYQGPHDWDWTITSHSGRPEFVGTRWSFHGQTASHYEPDRNATFTSTVDDGATNIPDEWLTPERRASMSSRGFVRVQSGLGRETYSRNSTGQTGSNVTTLVTFDTASDHPTEVKITRDGVLVYRRTYAIR